MPQEATALKVLFFPIGFIGIFFSALIPFNSWAFVNSPDNSNTLQEIKYKPQPALPSPSSENRINSAQGSWPRVSASLRPLSHSNSNILTEIKYPSAAAPAAPKKKINGRIVIALTSGVSLIHVTSIMNSTAEFTALGASATKMAINPSTVNVGLATGIQIDLNHFEQQLLLEGMFRPQFKYDATPILDTVVFDNTGLRSKITSTTALLKWSAGYQLWKHWVPYAGLGFGYGHNSIKTQASAVTVAAVTSHFITTTNNFIYSLEAGLRYHFSTGFYLQSGYEFVDLGKLNWKWATGATPALGALSTSHYHSNTINFTLALEI